MSLSKIVALRDAVDDICAAIDRGELAPSEEAMLVLGVLIHQEAGPLAHDLLCKIASRCKNGQSALRDKAQ